MKAHVLIGSASLGRPLFRASHLGPAIEYAHGSIDLLRPVIPGFNATGTPTALEIPLWQAAAALVFKATHSTWFGWANVASLLLFATGLWPFIQLARQYFGHRASGWATIFFLSQPIVVLAAGQDVPPQALGEGECRGDDRLAVAPVDGALYERPVDLDLVEWEHRQIIHRGISGAKIIHGNLHTKLFQPAQR